jgi:hypothetical protein
VRKMLETITAPFITRMLHNSDATAQRRRLPLWLPLTAIGLLVLALIAAVRHDPLNSNEQQLVGQWMFSAADDRSITKHMVFRSDRTFNVSSDDTTNDGTWALSDGTLMLSMNVDDPPGFAGDSKYREFYSVVELDPHRALFQNRNSPGTTLELHRAASTPNE